MIDASAGRSTDERLFAIHLGPRKTGTSSLQYVMSTNRQSLRDVGVVYPGKGSQHHTPANRFLGRRQIWETDVVEAVNEQPWQRMLSDIGDAPTGILSSEALSQARKDDVARMFDSAPSRRPLAVITYRPYEQLLTSTWQQLIKEGLREPLGLWARRTVEDWPEQSTDRFPRVIDLATLVETWGSVVGVENVAVVLVDAKRPRAIFEAFEKLLNLPDGALNVNGSAPRKRSMSAEEAELMRQTNQLLSREDSLNAYREYRAKVLAPSLDEGKADPRDHEVTLAADIAEQAHRRAVHMLERLNQLPVRPMVFGELEAITSRSAHVSPTSVPDAESVPSLAARLLAGAIQLSVDASDVEDEGRAP